MFGAVVAKLKQQATEECPREGKNIHDVSTPPREIKLQHRGLEFKSVATNLFRELVLKIACKIKEREATHLTRCGVRA